MEFIPFLKDFIFGGNVAFVKSVVSIDEAELQRKRLFDPDFADTRVMFGQAPYIVNAYLEYNNDSIGLAINLAFNTNGRRLSLVNAQGIPDVYEQPRGQMDFNISKTIGRRFSIKLAVKNILNDEFWSSYYYNGIHYNFEKYAMGRYYSIAVKYTIR